MDKPILFVVTICLALVFLVGCEARHDKTDKNVQSETALNSSAPQVADRIDGEEYVKDVPSTENTDTDADQSQLEQTTTESQVEPIDEALEFANALIENTEFTSNTTTAQDILAESNKPVTPFCQDLSTDNNTDEVNASCKKLSNRLASVSMQSCESANLRTTGCYSNNNFPILLREFPPLEDKKPKGKVLLIGGTHGDELTSVSIVFRWIEILNKHHSGLFHWHVIPVMNPDGLLLKSATRTNANGVDLNRNLPTRDWYEKAMKYWDNKTSKDPRKFPGLDPNSEPENQWLVDEINQFEPDVIVSVHAPYGVVDFDAPLLNKAPRSLGKLRLNLLGTYPGSLGNYAGINRSIPVITLELPHSWVMPKPAESTKIWEDMVGWLVDNVGEE
jgi:hypothetical protein